MTLVYAGASPVAWFPGEAFGAAELDFHLANLLKYGETKARAPTAGETIIFDAASGGGAVISAPGITGGGRSAAAR